MTNIRLFFKKTGRAKYISHLDMYRCFQRAVCRAGIPVWYTQGFHPHLYMTFPLPLSLGYESERECVDMKLTRDMKFAEIRRSLTPCFPDGIEILHVSEPKQDQKQIAFADYEIKLYLDKNIEEKKAQFEEFWNKESIIVEKLTKKKKVKQIDIKSMCTLIDCSAEDKYLQLKLRCVTGIETNLNPSLVVEAFMGQDNEVYTTTLRTAIYNKDMEIFNQNIILKMGDYLK